MCAYIILIFNIVLLGDALLPEAIVTKPIEVVVNRKKDTENMVKNALQNRTQNIWNLNSGNSLSYPSNGGKEKEAIHDASSMWADTDEELQIRSRKRKQKYQSTIKEVRQTGGHVPLAGRVRSLTFERSNLKAPVLIPIVTQKQSQTVKEPVLVNGTSNVKVVDHEDDVEGLHLAQAKQESLNLTKQANVINAKSLLVDSKDNKEKFKSVEEERVAGSMNVLRDKAFSIEEKKKLTNALLNQKFTPNLERAWARPSSKADFYSKKDTANVRATKDEFLGRLEKLEGLKKGYLSNSEINNPVSLKGQRLSAISDEIKSPMWDEGITEKRIVPWNARSNGSSGSINMHGEVNNKDIITNSASIPSVNSDLVYKSTKDAVNTDLTSEVNNIDKVLGKSLSAAVAEGSNNGKHFNKTMKISKPVVGLVYDEDDSVVNTNAIDSPQVPSVSESAKWKTLTPVESESYLPISKKDISKLSSTRGEIEERNISTGNTEVPKPTIKQDLSTMEEASVVRGNHMVVKKTHVSSHNTIFPKNQTEDY